MMFLTAPSFLVGYLIPMEWVGLLGLVPIAIALSMVKTLVSKWLSRRRRTLQTALDSAKKKKNDNAVEKESDSDSDENDDTDISKQTLTSSQKSFAFAIPLPVLKVSVGLLHGAL